MGLPEPLGLLFRAEHPEPQNLSTLFPDLLESILLFKTKF